MIYYAIQSHGSTETLEYLLRYLSPSRERFDVSLDMADQEVIDASSRFRKLVDKKIRVSGCGPLSWGGATLTREMINALTRSLEHDDWQWFVNLSGSCMPLRPVDKIFRILENRRRNSGKIAFCTGFQSKKEPLNIPYRPFSPEKVTSYFRVKFISDAELSNEISEGRLDPARNVNHRRSLKYVEVEKNVFELHRIKENKKDLRWKPWFGRQWVALHREVVERIVKSPVTTEVFKNLENSFISDESFFQELLFSDRLSLSSGTSNGNVHFQGGGSKQLDETMISQALKTRSLFARKVTPNRAKSLYDLVEEACR
ncbi:beta-1,6-N-acetylglucosaminyltransferase [Marimonas lutisalis]|uniref:beta-1,6-N-acetylglucosaminyltransferase n=1 Tax=Marimonas lutisalis TaxID=2545756 RepID=UPI0010F93CAE|nr:beta-1,6-N-acetylglucosaminyltransferase [Marimonas lutisalis]